MNERSAALSMVTASRIHGSFSKPRRDVPTNQFSITQHWKNTSLTAYNIAEMAVAAAANESREHDGIHVKTYQCQRHGRGRGVY